MILYIILGIIVVFGLMFYSFRRGAIYGNTMALATAVDVINRVVVYTKAHDKNGTLYVFNDRTGEYITQSETLSGLYEELGKDPKHIYVMGDGTLPFGAYDMNA